MVCVRHYDLLSKGLYKVTLRRGTWTKQSRSGKPLACIRFYSSTLTSPPRIENRMTCIQHYASTSKNLFVARCGWRANDASQWRQQNCRVAATEWRAYEKAFVVHRLYASTLTRPLRYNNQIVCIQHYASTSKNRRVANRKVSNRHYEMTSTEQRRSEKHLAYRRRRIAETKWSACGTKFCLRKNHCVAATKWCA